MKTVAKLIPWSLIAVLAAPWIHVEADAATPPVPEEANDALPAIIRQAEKGVFFLRILSADGKIISVGTGFLIDDKGSLLTSLHVMRPGTAQASSAEAIGVDGKTHQITGVTASEESLDLARLQLAEPPEGAVPIQLAGDEPPERGARVLVLGHPQGFRFVSTDGIVSAVNKTKELPESFRDGVCAQTHPEVIWIQTSAAISPGNSGGPMLDKAGKVIGIIQWMARGPSMNFALHIAPAKELIARPSRIISVADFARPDRELNELVSGFSKDYEKYQQAQFSRRTNASLMSAAAATVAEPPHPAVTYFPRLLALAEKNPESDVGFRALETLMRAAFGHGCPKETATDVRKASDRLIAGFRNHRRLISLLRERPSPSLPEAQEFLRELAAKSEEPEIRALAAFSLAATLDLQIEDAAPSEETMKLARLAADSPPEFTMKNATLASEAALLLDHLEHSSVGQPAPAFEVVDAEEKKFTLDSFRGKHVMVAFWDKSTEFFNQTQTLLDQVSIDYQIPIVGITFSTEISSSDRASTAKAPAWKVIADADEGTLKKAWHVTSSPTLFLLDPQGVIIRRFTQTQASSMTISNSAGRNSSFSSTVRSQDGSASLKDRISAALDSIPGIAAPKKKLMEHITSGPWLAIDGWDPAEPGERTVFFRKDGSASVKWIMNWELRPPSKLHLHLLPRSTGCTELEVDFATGEARVISPDAIRGRVMKLRAGPAQPGDATAAAAVRECLLAEEWNWYEKGTPDTESPKIKFRFLKNGTTSVRLFPAWELLPSGEVRVYLDSGRFWSFDFDLDKKIARSNSGNSQLKDSKAFVARGPKDAPPAPPMIPRPAKATAAQIDLSKFYNGSFKMGWLPSNAWSQTKDKKMSQLQPGLSTMGETSFDIRGVIQVSCLRLKDVADFPEQVAGIPIGAKAAQLHFLQACAWTAKLGTPIGHYVVHYADDSTEKIPLLYGKNIRGWTSLPSTSTELALTNATDVWKDSNAYSSKSGAHLRLAKFTWKNSKPESEIRSIDLVSAMTDAAPFLMAITTD